MSIQSDLQYFYDHEAKKYAETRQKFWHESTRIVNILEEILAKKESWKLRILELGAGSGRFANLLNEHFTDQIDYQGCDISRELLKYAQKSNPKRDFIWSDMLNFLQKQEQESTDVIVGIASVQHIASYKERLLLMKYAHRALRYWGTLLMINRAYSKRFIKKHWKVVGKSLLRTARSLGKHDRRDLMIPRNNKGKTYERYYHLFGLQELQKLTCSSWLELKECGYLDQQGQLTTERKNARNSRYLAEKKGIL